MCDIHFVASAKAWACGATAGRGGLERTGGFIMWSSLSRKCMVAMVIAACLGGVASVARAGDLPAIPADNPANYVPVAKRPRSEVLVKGEQWLRPDLTRATINDYRDLLGWILQIQFTDGQCDEFEQKIIVLWPTLLSWDVEEITGGTKLSADIRAMPPAQLRATHKDMNERVLKNLRKITAGAT